MINLIIIDDIPYTLEGLRYILSEEDNITVLGCAQNSREAISLIGKHRVSADLVIVDLELNEKIDNSPFELCLNLKEKFPGLQLLVLTVHKGRRLVSNLKKIGVKGYVSKNSPTEKLLEAIRAIYDGEQYFPTLKEIEMSSVKGVNFEAASVEEDSFKKLMTLTSQEFKITKLYMGGLSDFEIIDTLNISPSTLDSHRNRVFKKMGVSRAHQLVALLKNIL